MKKILIACTSLFLAAAFAPAAEPIASPEAAVLKAVDQFVEGFNKGDTKAMLAVGLEQMAIIDEFPPHVWHGAGAFAKWMSDFDADAAKHGITDASVSIGKPTHLDISEADAYVVLKVNYSFKRRGKLEEEIGSILTISLHKTVDGWRLTGWAWAKR